MTVILLGQNSPAHFICNWTSIWEQDYKQQDYKHKRWSELKSHIKLKHEGRLVTIEHLKMKKEDFKKKTCAKYSSEDI